MLAALPPGVHSARPPWLTVFVLVLPYLAGASAGCSWSGPRRARAGGRAAVGPGLRRAAGGVLGGAGRVLGRAAGQRPAGRGRPLGLAGRRGRRPGDRRRRRGHRRRHELAAPAGRKAAAPAPRPRAATPANTPALSDLGPGGEAEGGHTIYLDPWAGMEDEDSPGRRASAAHGPSSLP